MIDKELVKQRVEDLELKYYGGRQEVKMSRKLFISQPMNGRSDREIRRDRQRVVNAYKNSKDLEIIDSIINVGPQNAIQYLAKSIEQMNDADCVFMMKGWEKARECRIEHEVAVAYGKEVVYE